MTTIKNIFVLQESSQAYTRKAIIHTWALFKSKDVKNRCWTKTKRVHKLAKDQKFDTTTFIPLFVSRGLFYQCKHQHQWLHVQSSNTIASNSNCRPQTTIHETHWQETGTPKTEIVLLTAVSYEYPRPTVRTPTNEADDGLDHRKSKMSMIYIIQIRILSFCLVPTVRRKRQQLVCAYKIYLQGELSLPCHGLDRSLTQQAHCRYGYGMAWVAELSWGRRAARWERRHRWCQRSEVRSSD